MAKSDVALPERIALSPSEAGELVGLSRKSIDKAIENGELPYLKAGSRTIIRRLSLDAWLEHKEAARSQALAEMLARADAVSGGSHDAE